MKKKSFPLRLYDFFFNFFKIYRPTFKTATPTSRTQLKQQLQREQLQELERLDLERRVAENKNASASTAGVSHNQQLNTGSTSYALKVPLQSIGVDVPPQVLQVTYSILLKHKLNN